MLGGPKCYLHIQCHTISEPHKRSRKLLSELLKHDMDQNEARIKGEKSTVILRDTQESSHMCFKVYTLFQFSKGSVWLFVYFHLSLTLAVYIFVYMAIFHLVKFYFRSVFFAHLCPLCSATVM